MLWTIERRQGSSEIQKLSINSIWGINIRFNCIFDSFMTLIKSGIGAHIIDYFYNYKKRFQVLRTKTSSNLTFWICIINSVGFAYMVSWWCSYYSWVALGSLETLHPLVFEISIHLPNIFLSVICLTVLDKITHGMLIVNQFAQKLVFKGIQKFDLYYWRKFRRQGPITNTLFRIQQNFQNMPIHKRRQVILGGAAVVAVWYCFEMGLIGV